MKVLVSDNISPKCIEILKKSGLEVDVKTGMKPEELKACIGDYHGLIIRSATKVTSEIINAAKNLKVIGRAGSGLDNVDRAAATKKGIVLMNTPGGNTITTAEHSIALMVALARQIPQATISMKAGKWEKKKFMGVELFNKTLGIIGIGNIGSQVAKRAQGLAMNVIAYDPFLSEDKAKTMGVEKVDIKELSRRSDFITIHTPLTPETRNMINKETIKMMKPGVRIINCARGGIINEKDLYEALVGGKIAGAALDVFEKEPPENNPLLTLNNVISTPHLGASTKEAQENVAVAVAEQVVDYLIHETIRNAVNFPSIPSDQVARLQPFINLAEKLGGFAAQIFEGGVTEITIEYRGEASEINTSPVTIAAIKGFLTPILEETVNFVNALFIARERGIEVKETKSTDAGDYQSMVLMRLKAKDKESHLAGTLFSKKDPRIVAIDNFKVEIVPDGDLLFIYNNDKPGVIGNIGTLLSKNDINIARMHFGRETSGGRAISVVTIDTPATPQIIEKIKRLPNILSVKQITL
ncbi:MAG: phosphoglycerate dehydrogenase [Nitrospirae bacterium CG_4_10_14_0_8_um_filter_41_23]|nr:phosphoglycerate dehydrogenase [Nitrospirota bacterium]OIP59472.1 MAG: phosphoglycerate dehydrogenase [Nitrospirae bacterium CG2_30_41_42]PIQ93537.1 MAG: phosphoglycerate dehydrogenase [Nitrospirae bacterium CG11_big_fil_rev_8_21_14_0_20_41_14]PIV44725.1 MAG: phosphoglycerate dehydrogenase [Nitrospirae bacterium CG02_land_8_20_14_3_00_41_53]PIW87854.1 MAG: phosphoglycerate dehydrogenase [Nitrospirae bacterium CG_4_8_14_3_um_filter_41_47]PIY87590.1 MAG: phosphoglycerate dehydrogenase [Nitros